MEGRTTRYLIAAVALGCGGEPAPAAPTHPPPSEVLAMSVRVARSSDTFCPALEAGLVRSGIQVATDSATPAAATISCHVFTERDDSFLQITSNGETRMKFTVRVEVRSAQNVPVDQFVAEYRGYRSSPDEDAVSKMVLAFAYSPRIAAFARTAQTAAPVTTGAQPVATVSDQPHDTRDDSMWFAIDTVQCKIPARVDSCNRVRYYLQRFPNGAHAQEASDILAAAQPALEKLQKDDVAWQKSNHYECARMRSSDACVGVEAYDIQFPAGLHSEEAKRLLKNAGH